MDRFTDHASRAMAGAALDAVDRGRRRLDTDLLLLGLVEAGEPTLARYGVDPAAVRRELGTPGDAANGRTGDRELLASIGIDLDEAIRRAYHLAGMERDDPRLWTLRRSLARPLRLTLRGPAGALSLTGQSRKVVEVAVWAAGRRNRIDGRHLLWGLLADGTNQSVRVLHRLGVDLRALGRDIMGPGHAAAA